MTEREIIKRKILIKQQLIGIIFAEIEELRRKLEEAENDDSSTQHRG
jgi:hypothetical protein